MTKFIIVDSVKGGCGKSTEAIATAISCSKKFAIGDKSLDDHKSKVCVIDMDLLGTSMERMLLGDLFIKDMSKELPKIKPRAAYYLNDLVSGRISFSDEYKSGICINLANKMCCKVDFIISSPNEKDRRQFRLSNNSNYVTKITPMHFRGIIKKLINQLMSENYETVIFDMPPNSDVYTDCVFDILLDTEYRRNKNVQVELKIISTYDRAHVYANASWLFSLVEGKDQHWKAFNTITFLLNNNISASLDRAKTSEGIDLRKVIKEYVIHSLPNFLTHSTDENKLQFTYRQFNEDLFLFFLYGKSVSVDGAVDFSSVAKEWYNSALVDLIV